MSVFTGLSGPIILAKTRNFETAATASNIEALATAGYSGSFSPTGVGDMINSSLELVFPTKDADCE